MAVDLSEFVPSLEREVNPPGDPRFTGVSEDDWLGWLTDAFWEARLDGFLADYECDEDGLVVSLIDPDDPSKDMPRYLVGLIVLYAGIRVLRNSILNTSTAFRAKAGPVEFETQNSATVLAEMLKLLSERRRELLDRVEGLETPTFYFDAYTQRGHDAGAYWGRTTEFLVGLAS
jgi:hypothetical protein